MVDNINKISFGSNKPSETKKSLFKKTNDLPNDSLELSNKEKKSTLLEKLFGNFSAKKEINASKTYKEMIKAGSNPSNAKKIVEDKTLLTRYILFTSDKKDENGNLISGLKKPFNPNVASILISNGANESQLKEIELLADYGFKTNKITELINKEAFMTLISDKVDENGKLLSGLPMLPTKKEIDILKNYSNTEINHFLSLVSIKKDEEGNLLSGLTRPFTYQEAINFIDKTCSYDLAQLYLDMCNPHCENSKDKIISNNDSVQKILMLTGDKNSKIPSPYSKTINLEQAINIIEKNLNDEEIEIYINFQEEDKNKYIQNFSDANIVELIKKGCKEKESFQILDMLQKLPFNNYKNYIDLAVNPETIKAFSLLTTKEKDEKTNSNLSICNRELNPIELINLCLALENEYEKIPNCIQLINSGISVRDTIDIVKQTNYGKNIEDRLSEFLFYMSNEKDENGNLKSGLDKPLTLEQTFYIITNELSSENIPIFISMTENRVSADNAIDLLHKEDYLQQYKKLTNKESAQELGLKKELTPKEASAVLKENIELKDIPLFLEILSDEKDENGNLKSGLKGSLELLSIAGDLIKKGYTKEQIIKYSEFQRLVINKYDCVQPEEAEYMVDNNFTNEDLQRFIDNYDFIYRYKDSHIFESLKDRTEFQKVLFSMLKSNEQFDFFKNLVKLYGTSQDIIDFAKDKDNLKKFHDYTTNLKLNINGELKSLSQEDAIIAIFNALSEKDIQTYIDLKTINKNFYTDLILEFVKKFGNFKDNKSINELSLGERRVLIKFLISMNANLFILNRPSDNFKIIPNDKDNYCKTLDKLSKSIGIDTKKLNEKQKSTCYDGLKELTNAIKESDIDNCDIHLDFSRKDFINETKNYLSKLDINEQKKVMDYYGFEIRNNNLIGYPINVNNGEKLSEIENNETKKVIEELKPIVQKFSVDNKINIPQDKELEKSLNKILEGLPELKTIVGKIQDKTQDYTVDKHTLKVLQNITKNPKFENLSEEDKKILTIATLFHDIAKTEGIDDKVHPIESAFDAFYIIQKFNLPETEQLKLYQIIKSHDWVEKLNPENQDNKKLVKNIAFDMRHSNTFELSKILCEADLKSTKVDESYWTHFQNDFIQKSEDIQNGLNILEKTKIILPQTKIPKASEMKNIKTKTANDITNKVLYINQCNNDLSKYGFEKGTTVENWKGLVHGLDNETQLRNFDTFSIIDSEALLSTSYMDPKEHRVFRKQGLILDVSSSDIHAGYFRDFGSGYAKNLELLKRDYLFDGPSNKYRTYISALIKEKLDLTDEEYIEILKKFENCKSITDIEKIDKKFATDFSQIFNELDFGRRKAKRRYNEMLVSRPKIQGIFSYGQKYEDIPKFIRKYAQDNDLPIIIFSEE